MARIRTIKPEFPQSETMGKLSRDARLLFIQLWTIADDEGRARASSRMLASLLYPYDDDARALIDTWLEELETQNCIRRYEAEGSTFLEIINWLKHQKIDHPSKSRLPEFREVSRSLAPDLGPRTSTKDQEEDQEEDGVEVVSCETSQTVSAESPNGLPTKYAFECGVIRLNNKDFESWKKTFQFIDVAAELTAMADWASRQEHWFNAASGLLGKRNREQKTKIEAQRRDPVKWRSGMEGVV